MSETNKDRSTPISSLPQIEAATIADLTGAYMPSQDELWENVGRAGLGNLAPYALTEAQRAEKAGATARDAYLQGVGWTITTLLAQLDRARTLEEVRDLLGACFTEQPIAPE